ncbi:MAG: GGDEF domain-containing protein [Pseudomonadota bacterium]
MTHQGLCTANAESVDAPVSLTGAAMETLMPFHIRTDPGGEIVHLGATLQKLLGGTPAQSKLFDIVDVHRPSSIDCFDQLKGQTGRKLTLRLKELPDYSLKGVAVEAADGGLLINISLGLNVGTLVAQQGLGHRDFSPADPTIEMLYLFAIQKVLKSASESLNRRLQGDKTAAEEQASTDSLTGLANRRALEQHMERLLSRRRTEPFGLMQIDLDYFKAVNDTHGHAAGDFVLKTVSDRLRNTVRPGDVIARIGGDEFVVILADLPGADFLEKVAGRIIERTCQPIGFEDIICKVGASIGGTVVSLQTKKTASDLLADADQALYASKAHGRGRYTHFTEEQNA